MEDVKWSEVREEMYTPEELKVANRLIDLHKLYDGVLKLQGELLQNPFDAEAGCLDYKAVKALAATYELQDYLANQIAVEEALAVSELQEDQA